MTVTLAEYARSRREATLKNYSMRKHYEKIDEALEMTWIPRSFVAVALLAQAGRLPHTYYEKECRWCGMDYEEYPDKAGYCKHCHGSRDGEWFNG